MNSDPKYAAALEVLKRLRARRYEAYFAGGCVRDRFLDRKPKDYDIATSARPEEVTALFSKTLEVGLSFGVVVVIEGDMAIQVATFRTDGPYRDGRRPESVAYSNLRHDVHRRDFTINGLLWDPLEDRVTDLVGGREDLRKHLIRAIGDPVARFTEDKLRLLRAIRFACQLQFTLEEKTRQAITLMAREISCVSGERIREEMKAILLSSNRAEGLEMLREVGLLAILFPELAATAGVPQPPDKHPEGDVWTHTKLCVKNLNDPSFEVALATLLHDVGKPRSLVFADRIRFTGHEKVGAQMAEEICRRLRLSRAETDTIAWLVGTHMVYRDVREMRPSTLKRLLTHPHIEDLQQLHRADMLGGRGDLGTHAFVEEKRHAMTSEPQKTASLITGQDLLDMGFASGPKIGEILRVVEDAHLEGQLKTYEEALTFVRRHFPKTIDGG